MKKALLSLAVAALLSLPAFAQPAPGAPAASPKKPAATPAQPAPGIGSGTSGSAAGPQATPAPGPSGPPAGRLLAERPYNEAADAKADVAAAVAKAKTEKKRVLVTLGANWCGWCRSLDRIFRKDEKVAAALASSFIPVNVDVGRMKKNLDLAASWGADVKKGIPLLVVLDSAGKVVKVRETGSLEAGKGHDPAKVLAFVTENAGR
jgi:thiol-disulfide isomerase/thioredoxin